MINFTHVLLLSFIGYSNADWLDNYESDTYDFMITFNVITKISPERALRQLTDASEKNKEFLELADPIISLIIAASNSSYEASQSPKDVRFYLSLQLSSTEAITLQEINQYSKELFQQLRDQENRNGYKLFVNAQLPYLKNVVWKLWELDKIFHELSDNSSLNRHENKEKFMAACSSSSGPQSFLDHMISTYQRNCEILTKRSTQKYVELLKAIRLLEENLAGPELARPYEYKVAKRDLITSSNEYTRDAIIEKLQSEAITTHLCLQSWLPFFICAWRGRKFPTRDQVTDYFREITNKLRSSNSVDKECILREVLENCDYRVEKMEIIVNQLRIHLVKTELMLFTCAKFNGTTDSAELIETMVNTARSLLTHVRKYVEVAQNLTYSAVAQEEARRELGSSSRDSSSYNDTARTIRFVFQDRLHLHHFQVVVTKRVGKGELWSVKSSSPVDYVFYEDNDADINVHVFRYSFVQFHRYMDTEEWLEENRSKIEEALRNYDGNSSADSVLDYLQKKFRLVEERLFRHVMAFQRGNSLSEDGPIPSGFSCIFPYGVPSCPAIAVSINRNDTFVQRYVVQLFM